MRRERGWAPALAFTISFLILVANGRPIGSGDTNAVERTAASLVERGTVVLPEDPGSNPFTRPVEGGRVSIYPVLPAIVAAPLFFLFSLFVDLAPAALQMAGKLTAALLSASAVALLAHSYSRRVAPGLALGSALLFGLGTSVYSTSQALWQHPLVVLLLVFAIDALGRMDMAAPGPLKSRASRAAALGLALAGVARPASIPLCAVLFGFLIFRSHVRPLTLIGIACVPAGLLAWYNTAFFGAPWTFGPSLGGRFLSDFPVSIGGLLISPARGLLVFTPIAVLALAGLLKAARSSILARGLLGGAFVHFTFVASWNEWHGGESFGPRLLTDMLPALFYYLPEGLLAWPVAGRLLGILSISSQLLGGWTYDYRWERLHQRGQAFDEALWSWSDAPLLFSLREGVVIQGIPSVEGRRFRTRIHRFVPFGTKGSELTATKDGLRIGGEPLLRDIRLERGARIEDGWISLIHPGDALAMRADSPGERSLHVVGTLQGVLSVETPSASSITRQNGDFDLTLPVPLKAGDDLYLRAQTGALKLARVDIEAARAKP